MKKINLQRAGEILIKELNQPFVLIVGMGKDEIKSAKILCFTPGDDDSLILIETAHEYIQEKKQIECN